MELHAQAAADAAEMRTALRAVADAVIGLEARVGHHLMSSRHAVAAAVGGHVSVGGGGGCGGGVWAGVGTALGALLEAEEQQVVELHVQAVADAVEMCTALRAVDAVCALPDRGGCGRGGSRGGHMNGGMVSGAADGD